MTQSPQRKYRFQVWFLAIMVFTFTLLAVIAIATQNPEGLVGCAGALLAIVAVLWDLGPEGRRRLLKR
jgi:hypothetical protein